MMLQNRLTHRLSAICPSKTTRSIVKVRSSEPESNNETHIVKDVSDVQKAEYKFVEEPYSKDVPVKPEFSFGDAMAFTGPIPETVNGRLTMLGFVTGVAAELVSGKGLIEQFDEAALPVVLTAFILSVASFYPLLNGDKLEDYDNGVFTKDAEILNGRVAMMGFLSMLLIESVQHHALFPQLVQ